MQMVVSLDTRVPNGYSLDNEKPIGLRSGVADHHGGNPHQVRVLV